ncbi:hypothetical protein M5K25_022233 [Dendrobium thyrsiflorum]|uniref:Uncharacterized protein n=1 Tax=Dendrobium thyrsiflorum TaxID=117978 RepID=A0ABD0U5Z4_DENTH
MSTLCQVLCLHRGVVKKDIGSLPEKEEWIGSLPEKEDIGSLSEKEEWSGSLPEEEVAFAGRLEGATSKVEKPFQNLFHQPGEAENLKFFFTLLVKTENPESFSFLLKQAENLEAAKPHKTEQNFIFADSCGTDKVPFCRRFSQNIEIEEMMKCSEEIDIEDRGNDFQKSEVNFTGTTEGFNISGLPPDAGNRTQSVRSHYPGGQNSRRPLHSSQVEEPMGRPVRSHIRLTIKGIGSQLHTSMDNNMCNLSTITGFPPSDTSA